MNEVRQCPFEKAQDIDFMDPVVQENWFDAYDVIRETSPAYFMPQIGMYVLTRYDDIEYVLKNADIFTHESPDNVEPLLKFPEAVALYEEKGWPRLQPLGMDVPHHPHVQALVAEQLSAEGIRRREGFIRQTANDLVDEWIDDGEIEFLKSFAEPLPMLVIARILGFPPMDTPQLKEWSAAWVLPYSRGLTLEQETWAVEKHIELQHYIHDAIKEREKNPKDDVISILMRSEYYDLDLGKHRKLTEAEIIGMIDHMLIGGNETTAFALSNGLWLLFRHPEVYAELQEDHSKIKTFVEEALRIESPTQGLIRHVRKDVEIGGVSIPEGAVLSIRYGAGNRDPRRYPNPEKPDLSRQGAGRHLALGMGEHVCPGARLTRQEQIWSWEILLTRLRNIRPVEAKNTYEHLPGMWVRALKSIHMAFDKA
ncbi:MAG: cytochrome P450 [Pseudomonadales bacterium]|jgi:cytochrome P450|nr:cytochrome P450 [Pseudomonadales bacterium]